MSLNKHFLPEGDLVLEGLKGVARLNPLVTVNSSEKFIFRKPSKGKVTVLSGGGSGHEPTHAGFVGEGLLDAAVSGAIFASPNTRQILAALDAINTTEGTVIVVKNYTGDVIHFGLAAERAKAAGKNIELVIVADDVAVGREKGGFVGRRGLAGTVIVHKITGAAAEAGLNLKSVTDVANSVINNLVTIGASLDHCSVPGREDSQDSEEGLGKDELEVGMGIHNEPGVRRLKPIPNTNNLIKNLLPMLLSKSDKDRNFVPFNNNDDIVLLVNNLGGVSDLEFSALVETIGSVLKSDYNIIPIRVFAGHFTTSLNGLGFSITLFNLTRASSQVSYSIIDLLDAPTTAPGWKAPIPSSFWKKYNGASPKIVTSSLDIKIPSSDISLDPNYVKSLLESACKSIKKEEPRITKYDTYAGDGDCGETLVVGCDAILKALNSNQIKTSDAIATVAKIAEIVETSMGGTSGGLYSIFLSALAQGIKKFAKPNSKLTIQDVGQASQFALESLYKYTKARVGDKTLVDALEPFVKTLSSTADIHKAAKAAREGSDATRKLDARFGRASYVGKDELKVFESEGGLPDPGSVGIVALTEGFASAK